MYESFDEYIAYLKQNESHFPKHVYEFASDVNRHTLTNPHSLHDSWVTSICFRENRNPNRPFSPKPNLELVLLGQMHDRDILLNYEEVEEYDLIGRKNPYNWADTYLGDIDCHQVKFDDNGLLVHEILLVSESVIKVVCKDFACTEVMHA